MRDLEIFLHEPPDDILPRLRAIKEATPELDDVKFTPRPLLARADRCLAWEFPPRAVEYAYCKGSSDDGLRAALIWAAGGVDNRAVDMAGWLSRVTGVPVTEVFDIRPTEGT